jgi:hypothetical protein
MSDGWIGVDLDATLAHYDGWRGSSHIGTPVPAMLARVRGWLAAGQEVRIMTARASLPPDDPDSVAFAAAWSAWSMEQFGVVLAVTATKTFSMIELWDDRAVQVVPNTGLRADGKP